MKKIITGTEKGVYSKEDINQLINKILVEIEKFKDSEGRVNSGMVVYIMRQEIKNLR